MSIEGRKYIYDLVCDVCGEYAEKTFDNFYDAVDYRKANGWKSRKDKDGDWEDVCPECLDEEAD